MPRVHAVPPHIPSPAGGAPRAPRDGADRCPTAIRLHDAADGLIARVRIPGGRLSPDAATLLADWAEPTDAAGADRIEITGRGNLQLRGLTASQSGPLAAALHGAGLLPSEPHDQARTIVASPLAGRLGGAAPVDDLVQALDTALCADPSLTALSGRFLMAVDDGTGAVDLARADLALVRTAAASLAAATDERVTLLVGGAVAGSVALADAPAAVTAAARAFLELAAGTAWQVRELAGGGAELIAALRRDGVVTPVRGAGRSRDVAGGRDAAAGTWAGSALPPVGVGRQADGRGFVRALAPLGRLTAAQLGAAARLAEAASSELRIAGDRTITIPDIPLRVLTPTADGLAGAGLYVSATNPGIGLTACAGLGCRSTRGDVRAAAALRLAARRPGAPREHLVGCERRCGAPGGAADPSTFVLAAGEPAHEFAARIAAATIEADAEPGRGPTPSPLQETTDR